MVTKIKKTFKKIYQFVVKTSIDNQKIEFFKEPTEEHLLLNLKIEALHVLTKNKNNEYFENVTLSACTR